jgi:hypothetical protein
VSDKKKPTGQPAMNRNKQAGMAIKTVVALLVGLALASIHLAEAQQSDIFASGGTLVVAISSRDGLIIAADSRMAVVGTAFPFVTSRTWKKSDHSVLE